MTLFLDIAFPLVYQGAQVITSPTEQTLRMKPEDGIYSHVTPKDVNISDMMIAAFNGTGYLVVSEEAPDTFRNLPLCQSPTKSLVVIDPNDGTFNLSRGRVEETACAAALICRGLPTQAAIAMPGRWASVVQKNGDVTGFSDMGMVITADGHQARLHPFSHHSDSLLLHPPEPIRPDGGKQALLLCDPNNAWPVGLAGPLSAALDADIGANVDMVYSDICGGLSVCLGSAAAFVFGPNRHGRGGPKIWDWAPIWAVARVLELGFYRLDTGEEITECKAAYFTPKGKMRFEVLLTHPATAEAYLRLANKLANAL